MKNTKVCLLYVLCLNTVFLSHAMETQKDHLELEILRDDVFDALQRLPSGSVEVARILNEIKGNEDTLNVVYDKTSKQQNLLTAVVRTKDLATIEIVLGSIKQYPKLTKQLLEDQDQKGRNVIMVATRSCLLEFDAQRYTKIITLLLEAGRSVHSSQLTQKRDDKRTVLGYTRDEATKKLLESYL